MPQVRPKVQAHYTDARAIRHPVAPVRIFGIRAWRPSPHRLLYQSRLGGRRPDWYNV